MRKTIKKYQTPGDSLPAAPGFNNQLDPALVVANSSWNPNLLKEIADKKALESLNASVVDAGIKFNRTNTTDNNEGTFGDKDAGTTGNGDLNLEALKKKKSFEGKLSNASRAISGLTDIASSFIDVDENSSFKQQQMVGDALLQSGNPYAMAAGAAFKGLSAMDQALGINTNTINKNEANVAGISKGERILNNVLGFLPGTGAGLLAGKTDSFNFNEDLLKVGSSYGKSISDMQTMEGMSEGRYLFGKKKINDKMAELEEDQSILTSALKTNTLRKNSDYGQNLTNQKMNREMGFDYSMTSIGKHGMKLMDKEDAKRILELKRQEMEGVTFLKDGGKVNILPEGKLHAHKHHLEDVDERLEDLTKKGIPIVAISEDGTMSQVAEVEKEELILHLDLTQQIEELWKQYKDAESVEEKNRIAFECGDLLCREIITNTEDNTNLLKEL